MDNSLVQECNQFYVKQEQLELAKKFLELKSGSIYYSVVQKLLMLIKGVIHSVLIFGPCGVGKTYITEQLLSLYLTLDLQYIKIKGACTPLQLYLDLYENNGKIIIFDDCDDVLTNKRAKNILKSALDDKPFRKVSYHSTKLPQGIPGSFIFNSKIIFISNFQFNNSDNDLAAVVDRCFIQEFKLDVNEKLEFIEKIILPNDFKNTTREDRDIVFNMLKETVRLNGSDFSFRTFGKLLDLYIFDKPNFSLHLNELLPGQNELQLLIKLLKEDSDSAMLKFMEQTGKSRRTFFYYKKKVEGLI